MKVSIIIPTFNDEKYILDTVNSIENQTYKDYEVIIVNDGSLDNTEKVIKKFIHGKNNYRYIYQSNQDQLKAVIAGSRYITGDIVFILHSDDVFASNVVLEKAVSFFEKNSEVEAIISDLILMDEKMNYLGEQKVKKFINSPKSLLNLYLYLGRNIYCDTAFFRKNIFLSTVYENYLIWNMPFWFNEKGKILNVKNVEFPFVNYRQSDSNYILSDLGKLNVLNGELRTAYTLSNLYTIPFYNIQFNIYRIFNKLHISYMPFYIKKRLKNKYKLFKYIISKRYTDNEINNNIYLSSMLNYYKNKSNRVIQYNFKNSYTGNEIRLFNKKLLDNKLDKEYMLFFEEMSKGFNKIITNDKNKMQNILKFLNIDAEVEEQK